MTALVENGASSESLAMISAFLSGRRMWFKVNGSLSSLRDVRGGSPQGTKLGNFLFVMTINNIEDKTSNLPSNHLTPRSMRMYMGSAS